MLHYIAQRVSQGKIKDSFRATDPNWRPVHADDVASVVAGRLDNAGHGHFALQGNTAVSMQEILHMIERASGKAEGQTGSAGVDMTRFVFEFLSGVCVDHNLNNLADYFA